MDKLLKSLKIVSLLVQVGLYVFSVFCFFSYGAATESFLALTAAYAFETRGIALEAKMKLERMMDL